MHLCVCITLKIKKNFDRMQHRFDVCMGRELLKEVECTTEKAVGPMAHGQEKGFFKPLSLF